MSWISSLYQTYENNKNEIGKWRKNQFGNEYTLLPISHTTQTAHIEVTVTEDGDFHSARLLERDEASTLIPATEEAANRSGIAANRRPFPLHDKLSFVAGDFIDYAGKIRDEEPYQYYIELLEDWVMSPYSTGKLRSIYQYIRKERLVKDLLQENILVLDKSHRLIDEWKAKHGEIFEERPRIFSLSPGGQYSAFVRFNVYSPKKQLKKIWHDPDMYQSFINYYHQSLDNRDYCMVTGKKLPITERHSDRIRHAGDKAKLISANDKSGFTFRGRFDKSHEAASISYEVSQKAHNALKWLIQKQGRIIDDRVFLVWSQSNVEVLDLMDDSLSLSQQLFSNNRQEKDIISFTNEEIAREFSKAIDGYKSNLSTKADIKILVIDSATTGRMAVLYYREMEPEIYFKRLTNWHLTCSWRHRYRKNEQGEYVEFEGTPATRDIALAVYGKRGNQKVVKVLMERLLPCILDERPIPKDIIRNAYYRSINPQGMERWEWEKTLSITCALINREEKIGVALNENIKDRDYLFGRLLAIADVLERRALRSEENRATNAIRYMNAFANHPERTWKTIQANLQPYQERLGDKGIYLSSLIDEVASKINYEDFNNKPLSGKFLLGFYSQRHELYKKRTNEGENE